MQIQIVHTKIRGCGERKEYGLYLVGGGSGSENGALARFVRINPPVPYPAKFHRGPRIVDGDAILSRLPLSHWWAGSSKDTEQKKSADQFALDTFGMTLNRRLTIGECRGSGARDIDEALAIVTSQVTWNPDAARWFASVTRNKIQELPRIAADYSKLHEALLYAQKTRRVDHLVNAQAAVWRIAYNLPPRRRGEFIPDLSRILIRLGMTKDAQAMLITFGN